jgi:hypothetical protein
MAKEPTKRSADFWNNHIQQYRASGLSQRAYSLENNLNEKTLSNQIYFRNKAAKSSPSKNSPFAKVVINHALKTKEIPAPPKKQGGPRLLTSGGMVLEFDAETSPEWIGKLLKTIEGGIA